MYGPRFLRDYGNTAPPVWQSAIRTLTDAQIQRGMRRLAAAGSGSVPTLPVFVKACRQPGDDEGETRPASTYLPPPSYDDFHAFGQRCLFAFIRTQDRISDPTLKALVSVKNKLVNDFREMHREDEVTAEQVREALMRAFEKVIAQRVAA